MWNKGEPLPVKTAWNPFSQDVPFITFASHPIYWHKGNEECFKNGTIITEASFCFSNVIYPYFMINTEGGVQERSTYDMELFAQKLQRAVEAIGSACIHHSPIVIQSYLGLTSLLHNKTSMGFFKVRGKFSF